MRYRTLEPGEQTPKETIRAIAAVPLHELKITGRTMAVYRCENPACPVPELVVRYDFNGRGRIKRPLVCPVCYGPIEQTRIVRLVVLVPGDA